MKDSDKLSVKGLNVYLVDDHALFREGLSFLLSKVSFVNRVYEASSGEEFLRGLNKLCVKKGSASVDRMDSAYEDQAGFSGVDRAGSAYGDQAGLCGVDRMDSAYGDQAGFASVDRMDSAYALGGFDASNGSCVDVALVDIEMPGMNGIEATKRALAIKSDLKVLALSMYSEESYYLSMIEAGAVGFMLKNSSFSQVKKALEDVSEGKNYFSEEVLRSLVDNIHRRNHGGAQSCDISEREAEILELICRGFSNAGIAEELSISKRTVDKHRENLLLKSGAVNTAQLVVFAIKNGFYKI